MDIKPEPPPDNNIRKFFILIAIVELAKFINRRF